MDIAYFSEHEEMLKLREKLLAVEKERLAGKQGCSIEQLEKSLNDVIRIAEYKKRNNLSND